MIDDSSVDSKFLRDLAAAPHVEPDFGATTLAEGSRVARSYRIESLVARGTMGVVYRAKDVALNRSVAIKIYTRRTPRGLMKRLLHVAGAASRLSHPNVATIYEVGRHRMRLPNSSLAPARPFVAMEFIEGATLSQWLRRGGRSWHEILEVYLRVGNGLAAAHAVGAIHGAFEADSVLVSRAGRPCVIGFGVAAAAGGAHADQAAFCEALFDALYGGPPQWMFFPSALVPRVLERAIRRGLRGNPSDRFPSMSALLHELSLAVS